MLQSVLSPELLDEITTYLDVPSLIALELVSTNIRQCVAPTIERRCKQECFTTLLYPTIATYRMLAAVPDSWKQLYLLFSGLREFKWTVCENQGTSSSLRSLKSDNQEYTTDMDVQYLLRSGGHYWFTVWQSRVNTISLATTEEVASAELDKLDAAEKEAALAFLRSPRSIVIPKWEKIRGAGIGPCPRRHHSMTCLVNAMCDPNVLRDGGNVGCSNEKHIPIRRILFFGGQGEGIPFEAFNDLYLLAIDGSKNVDENVKTAARWIKPDAGGQPPSRRCGHEATLLSPNLLLISGGSDGTVPIPRFDIFLLHVQDHGGLGTFRWSTPVFTTPVPSGRAMHNMYRVSERELLVYGGRQVRQSNGLLDVQRLRLQSDDLGDEYHAEWSTCETTGAIPSTRRGHTTTVLGQQLILVGGQCVTSGDLHCDVRVLRVPSLKWSLPKVHGESPCPRRGFKLQYFGTSMVLSSGFVGNPQTGRIDQQLPDSDVHLLTF